MTDDLDIDVIEEMMGDMAASDEVTQPSSSSPSAKGTQRFNINRDRFKKVVPNNIVDDKPADSVPSSAGEQIAEKAPSSKAGQRVECESCDDQVLPKDIHTLKTKSGKVSKLCKKCYDAELELPPIVPGDMSQPQNAVEQFAEADRRFGRKVVDNSIVKETEKVLNSEALLDEDLLKGSMDPERFKEVYINVINQECIGRNRAQIEESIRKDHEMLFDKRAGIQAKLAFRQELLKSASAEERAAALKEDWLVKPLRAKAEKIKTARTKSEAAKPRTDPIESMRRGLLAKGMSAEVVEKKIKAFLGTDDD